VSTYTAVVNQDGDWWIGWVEEVPGVNAQEPSRDELVASLKVVLQEALEMNRAEARAAAGSSFEELALAL
jgi:predicted RNase H-like HicB family nuclease